MENFIFCALCQKQGLKVSGNTRKHAHERKLMKLGKDVDELTWNGSKQPPSAAISASAPSLSMSPDDLLEIVSAVLKCLSPFNKLSG